MAENETTEKGSDSSTAVAEIPSGYNIRVEDAGPATKKVFVEVPKEKVAEKIAEQFKELRQGAHIPGFRKGKAPPKLIEKKFSADVKEQVRRTLISESYEAAIEQHSLQVLGEPEFDNPDAVKIEEDAPLNYSFTVEIQPDITLPELKGFKVKKPMIPITEEHVDQAMTNLREQQGTLTPVEDRGVEDRDQVIGDVHVKVDDKVVSHQHDATINVRPGRLAGLQIDDLPAQLAGAKSGESREVKVKVPDNYPAENLRGKDVVIEIAVKDIKKLEPIEINDEFLQSLGFTREQELRDALRDQMVERIDFDIKQAMRRQITDQLLTQVEVKLPTKLSDRQTDRVVNRRAVDLLMKGIPRERIEQNLEQLRTGAADEAVRELKTFFILQQVAKQLEIEVSEGELNSRIATLAYQQGRRPERLKQEMSKDGNTLTNLYVQMREEKAIDKILQTADIEEIAATPEQSKAAHAHPDKDSEST
ncbi:MAG TPA: trigger factor [Tepidisphaeraceae bacterium]|jgi:trigger factor|nr:trigger factor [Tepidisphaeraceae bacterium]